MEEQSKPCLDEHDIKQRGETDGVEGRANN